MSLKYKQTYITVNISEHEGKKRTETYTRTIKE